MVAEFTIMDRFLELMASNPSPQQVLDFKANEIEQAKIHELIDKSKSGNLSPDTRAEIAIYLKVEDAIVLAKANAYYRIKTKAA